MNPSHPILTPRAEELLVDQAVHGLSHAEQAELDALLNNNTANADNLQDEFMQTAALIQLGMLDIESQRIEKMPAHVHARILADAAPATPTDIPGDKSGDNIVPFAARQEQAPRPLTVWRNPLVGWAVAAALAIALVVVRTDIDTSLTDRGNLIASAPDLIAVQWQPSEFSDFKTVTGDVVWSDANQTGYMRLAGMPVNNPTQQQYQLWIVAPGRAPQPVDGGVFDIVSGDGEIIVPINAKLDVSQPVAFAITLEKPGGVVVSEGPLLVVAPVPAAS
jgi:anti-sigma-K factor RskA